MNTAASTTLTTRLNAAANNSNDKELSGLLRWACLHIQEQDEALATAQQEADAEMNQRIKLESASHTASGLLRQALGAIADAMPAYVDIARDTSHHVNLMAVAHGDPDYGTEQKPQKHVDVRGVAPRKTKKETN